MPFSYQLAKNQQVEFNEFDNTTPTAMELQALYDVGDKNAYTARLRELNAAGRHFRVIGVCVCEAVENSSVHIDISIYFKVKGSVITWEFNAPKMKDQTAQEFRDLLYATAADAHDKVEFGCQRYYRGSNAYHLKTMHAYGGENDCNHNHYRRNNGEPITPKEVAEHLKAFMMHPNGKIYFPDWREVPQLIDIFQEYWNDWTYTGPDRPISLKELYETENSQLLDEKDKQEAVAHLHEQEPCRADVNSMESEAKRRFLEERVRGLSSALANTRQLRGTTTHAGCQPLVEEAVVRAGMRRR